MRDVRLALGGVAHKPWRARPRSAMLSASAPPTRSAFARAADAEMAPAVPRAHNGFKIELAKRDDRRDAVRDYAAEEVHDEHHRRAIERSRR